jgi:hypothetical protein
MRCNTAAAVRCRNARFAAQRWDQDFIEVARADSLCPIDEEIVNEFTRLLIENFGLGRANTFPGFDGLAYNAVDRFRECSRGLVDRYIEETDSIGRLIAAIFVSGVAALPTYSPEAEARNLVAPQACKQPDYDQRTDDLNGIPGRPRPVLLLEITDGEIVYR